MKRFIAILPFVVLGGCVIRAREPVVYVRPAPVVVAPAPVVVEDPAPVYTEGGVVVDVEPAFDARVYCYDPGYPPGCYFYGGFVYYGGHRYERGFFRDRYVRENIRLHRFEHVDRARVDRIRAQHHEEFKRTGGHVEHHDEHHKHQ